MRFSFSRLRAHRHLLCEVIFIPSVIPDFIRLHRSLKKLYYSRPNLSSKPILLLLPDDPLFSAKLFYFLCIELIRQGHPISVVLKSRFQSILLPLLLRILPIHKTYYLDSIEPEPSLLASLPDQIKTPSGVHTLFSELPHINYLGVNLGLHLLSTKERSAFQPGTSQRTHQLSQLDIHLLRTTAKRVAAFKSLLLRLDPLFILVGETNYLSHGPYVDLICSMSRKAIQVIQPYSSKSVIVSKINSSTRRSHPAAVSKATLEMACLRSWTDTHELELATLFEDRYTGNYDLQSRNLRFTIPSSHSLRSTLSIPDNTPTAVVFSHVLWDANRFYGNDLYSNYYEWFTATVRAAALNPHVHWIIKIHPANIWKLGLAQDSGNYLESDFIASEFRELPSNISLLLPSTSICPLQLFREADYCVTVRGTAGLEMASFGKPVILAGSGRYSHLGFTVDCSTVNSYISTLMTLHLNKPLTPDQTIRAKWHCLLSLKYRELILNNIVCRHPESSRRSNPLMPNAIITPSPALSDSSEFCNWALNDSTDYSSFPR